MKGVIVLIFVLISLMAVAVAKDDSIDSNINLDYKAWKAKYKPTDNLKGTQQKNETQAETTFKANAARIAKHNSDINATYKQELNANADMTANEIKKKRKGLIPETISKTSDKSLSASSNSFADQITQSSTPSESINLKNAPKSLNLTLLMSPVKNQLECGACWAFASLSVIEYWSKVNKTNWTFSEQNLMDCCKTNDGCEGGGLSRSLACMINIGVALESKYPYKAINNACPKIANPDYKMPNAAFSSIGGDEDMLVKLLSKYGPILVGIATENTGFNFYKKGVFYEQNCSNDPSMADHAMVVVGFGTTKKGEEFWIVRNSWGPDWGLNGYIHIAKNRNNTCGIANSAGYYLRR